MSQVNVSANFQVDGVNYPIARTVTAPNKTVSEPVGGVPAAKHGTLSTRTSNSDGTLTMDPGHGITTGQRLDLYWSGGARYGATVGTVSVNSVPFTGGTGDNLPVQATDMYVSVPTLETVSVVGNNAALMVAYSSLVATDLYGYVVFCTSGDVFIAAYKLTPTNPNAEWDLATNPFAGQTIGHIYFSHGNTSARTMGSVLLYS